MTYLPAQDKTKNDCIEVCAPARTGTSSSHTLTLKAEVRSMYYCVLLTSYSLIHFIMIFTSYEVVKEKKIGSSIKYYLAHGSYNTSKNKQTKKDFNLQYCTPDLVQQ